MLDNITNDSIPFFLPTSSYYHLCVLNETAQTTEQPTAIKKNGSEVHHDNCTLFYLKRKQIYSAIKINGNIQW